MAAIEYHQGDDNNKNSICEQEPLLLTWFNFNPGMDK